MAINELEWVEIKETKLSIFNLDNDKVGYLIKLKGETEEYLIGDMNSKNGFCECCNNDDEIVIAYKIVFIKNNDKKGV